MLPRRFIVCTIALTAAGLTATMLQTQQPDAGAFTPAQATAGRTLYTQTCSGCHGAQFQGSGDAPALAGADFMLQWRSKTSGDLLDNIQKTMPPATPGTLSQEDATAVVAYILRQNGAQAGQRPLNASAVIGTIANGQPPRNPAQNQGGTGGGLVSLGAGTSATAGVTGGVAPSSLSYGVTVPGTVSNYVPVTPEMLRNPPPEDWLMARRNYQAWSYSPLSQINRSNVKNLQLKWAWTMNDTGANETTPIVHNGVLYLVSKNRRSDLGNPHRPRAGPRIRRHSQRLHR
jgi:alcohol dehydrogenase (cytochrome c)